MLPRPAKTNTAQDDEQSREPSADANEPYYSKGDSRSKGEGNEMAQWILKANGKIVPRRTVRQLNAIEISSETEIKKPSIFDQLIEKRWGSSVNPPSKPPPQDDFLEYEDDDENPCVIPDFDDPVDAAGRVINQQPLYDRLIHAELTLAQGDELRAAKVIG